MKKHYLIILSIILTASVSLADITIRKAIKESSIDYLATHFMNGIFLFTDANGIIEKGAIGISSIARHNPLDPDQIMPIASTTKNMTAVVILKLQERGQLNVKDNVAKHLDKKSDIWQNNKIPDWAHKVTIHNLLTHSSGIAEYFQQANLDTSQKLENINKQIANFITNKELSFEPGEKFNYSNTNYVLLGLIIETITKTKAKDFFKQELFIPLGMKNTKMLGLEEALQHQKDPESADNATRYFIIPTGGKPDFYPAKHSFVMTPFTDGGCVSTSTDLITWHRALHSGKILSEDSYKQMTTGYYETTRFLGKKNQTGYGIYITELENNDILYHLAGNALGIRCESGCIKTKDMCYAILSNTMTYIPDDMKRKVDKTDPKNQLDIIFFLKHVLNSL